MAGCRANKAKGTITACCGCDGINPLIVVLDFTGHEDMLEKLRQTSEDVAYDVICVMDAVTDGTLTWRDR
jgi:hypothetical protein